LNVGDKIWITKGAITSGIIETTVRKVHVNYTYGFEVNVKSYFGYQSYKRDEVAFSLEAALDVAETQRTKKLASLERQLAKIEVKVIKVKVINDE